MFCGDAKKATGPASADHMNDAKGAFARKQATHRNWIKKGGEFEPEAGRYHLYISWACPWANRTASVRMLKGLEDVIGLSVVHPTWQRTNPDSDTDKHAGWVFRNPDDAPLSQFRGKFGSFPCDGCIPCPMGSKTIREIYDSQEVQTSVYSVPVLYDTKTKKIVNNESSEIIVMLNSAFGDLAKNKIDLCPADMADAMKAADDLVYPNINNGVYRCGFAKSQVAYEEAWVKLNGAMQEVESILSKQRYIAGNRLTMSDIRLFMTLVRFDEVYIVYFKCTGKAVREYPNMMNYCREMYQMLEPCINMRHIKTHYFTSHPDLNFYALIPVSSGTVPSLKEAHDRAEKFPLE